VTDDDEEEEEEEEDDEKRHVLGNLILFKHRYLNFKYRFELDGIFFRMKLYKKCDCESYLTLMRENSKMHFLIRHFYLRESCV
jgi:hypothetical protein